VRQKKSIAWRKGSETGAASLTVFEEIRPGTGGRIHSAFTNRGSRR
jgi:hypothetical protein